MRLTFYLLCDDRPVDQPKIFVRFDDVSVGQLLVFVYSLMINTLVSS